MTRGWPALLAVVTLRGDVCCPDCGHSGLVLYIMDAVGYVSCRNCHFLGACA